MLPPESIPPLRISWPHCPSRHQGSGWQSRNCLVGRNAPSAHLPTVWDWHQFRATIEGWSGHCSGSQQNPWILHKSTFLVGIHWGIPLPPSAVSNLWNVKRLHDYLYRVCTYITHHSTMSIYQRHPTSSTSHIPYLPLPTHRAKAVERRATWYLAICPWGLVYLKEGFRP